MRGIGSEHDYSRSEGVAMLPFLSSSVVAIEALSRPVSVADTEGSERSELIFFLIVSVGSTKPDTKRYSQFSTVVRTQALHLYGPGFES